MKNESLTRRRFLSTGGAAAAGLTLGAQLSARAQETTASGKGSAIRCGFVGVGGRGTTLLKAVVGIPDVQVVGICDIDDEHRSRAVQVVEGAGGRKPDEFDDWSKLLARDDIPAVVSALPCDLHYSFYRDALASGKHLYGEKPMCLKVEHADELVKRAREAGTVFQIGFQRRFNSVLQASVKAFQSGIIGKPFDGRGVRFGSGGPYRRPGEWFSFRERSGDWMLEQAVHHWDTLNWALGELPVSAYGTGRQDLFKDWDPKRDVSDYYTAVVQYASGLTFTWTHTWASPPDRHFGGMYEQLIGPKGGIDLSDAYVAFRKGGSPDGERRRQLAPEERGNRTEIALRSFFDCARSGRAPVVGVEDGRSATLFGLLVRTAVYERRTVTMEEVLGAST